MRLLKQFVSDESGATAIEYSMIGGLDSLLVITGATTIGSSMYDLYYNKLAVAMQ